MPHDPDHSYLQRRARESLAAQSAATDRSARLAHGRLAAAYARRAAPAAGDGDEPSVPAADEGVS